MNGRGVACNDAPDRFDVTTVPLGRLGRFALAYAAHGWPVFPCVPRSKQPLTAHGFHDATLEREQVHWWWGTVASANIGVRTGAGLLVVDVDPAGLDAWRRLVAEHGLAETLTAETPRGGLHVYLNTGRALRNTCGRIAEGIDSRCEGGYIIAPPSRTPAGSYRWLLRAPIADAPAWLEQVLDPPPRTPPGPATFRYASTAYGRAILEAALGRVAAAPEGQRNATLAREAFVCGAWSAGGEIDPGGLLELLVDACPDPDRRKVWTTAQRQLAAGAQYPRRPM